METSILVLSDLPEAQGGQNVSLVTNREVNQDIDQYLNESAFLSSENHDPSPTYSSDQREQELEEQSWSSFPKKKPLRRNPGNSIFHNFQKHLITIIKRQGNISPESLQGHSSAHVALLLWNCFLRTKSHSKKVLHMVFGGSYKDRAKEELGPLFREIEELKVVKNQFSWAAILDAQALLRQKIVENMKECSRQNLMNYCHVHKVDEFFGYLKTFLVELKDGTVTLRMLKSEKMQMIKGFKSKSA